MKDSVIGMAHALTYDGEGLPEERDVSPPKSTTDATRLSFPIGWVAAIVLTVGGFGVQQAMSLAAMRSDVRDILTRMEMQARLQESDKRAQDLIFETTGKSVEQLRAQTQLLQLQYAELSKQILRR